MDYRDARYEELADDNIPSQKYRDSGIPGGTLFLTHGV